MIIAWQSSLGIYLCTTFRYLFSLTFSPISAFSCIFLFICWIYLWHSLALYKCSKDVDKVTPKNTLFCIYLRNCLLLFLLLSVFYHKIYVLNVIAGAKSHVNFISFVFPFVRRFFMGFISSFSFGSSCVRVSVCVCSGTPSQKRKKQQHTIRHFALGEDTVVKINPHWKC